MFLLIGHSHFERLFRYFEDEKRTTFSSYRKFALGGMKLDHLSGPVSPHWPPRKKSLPRDFVEFMSSASPGDSIVVFLGDNDMDMDPDLFVTKFMAYFSLLKNRFLIKSLTILPLLPHYDGARGDIWEYNKKAQASNHLLREACNDHEGFYFNKITFPFPGTDKNGGSQGYRAAARYFGPDGVHLNDAGNEKLASSLKFVLKK